MKWKMKNKVLNRKKPMDRQIRPLLMRFYIFLLAFILVISLLSLPVFQNKVFHLNSIEQMTSSESITNMLLTAMSTEMPELEHSFESRIELPSLSTLAFEITTGIKPTELSTILGKGLPGFDRYSTEIYVAGEGTDYSTLPIESPPPDFDELLKDEESTPKEEPEEPKDQPKNASVFIYHSHSWEAFRPLMDEDAEKPSDSSSVDPKENILHVGSMISKELEQHGIPTIHDQTNIAKALNAKGLQWSDSYKASKDILETATTKHNELEYFIDVHRDAAGRDVTTKKINGKSYARLYFIVGKEHKDYQKNREFMKKLNTKLEEKYPGISRGIFVKDKYDGNGVYNQNISEKAILIEVGGIDNTEEELKNTAKAFADVFSEFYDGAVEVDAKSNE
ncbi:stage II sporulation protein P [Salinibacillus xinjiangensis]|uniref:Stage II sporulation protein P n=1 Tax=Salinibacillus xinjiangensis TaxID=1229268 RepID=A0A6G1XBA0_9BACI|nr:stage II sporulation protein P [Salinibacillus xinjiangensis]MRG88293.1 stage II sporulation protein P [Salinibacillus xinjiangensis]